MSRLSLPCLSLPFFFASCLSFLFRFSSSEWQWQVHMDITWWPNHLVISCLVLFLSFLELVFTRADCGSCPYHHFTSIFLPILFSSTGHPSPMEAALSCSPSLCCVASSCVVSSCLVLCCAVLSCIAFPFVALSCLVLRCVSLSCLVFSCCVFSCRILS